MSRRTRRTRPEDTRTDAPRADVEHDIRTAFAALEGYVTSAGTDRESWRTLQWYVLPDLVIEVELDWRDQGTFVLVSLPSAGGRAGGHYVDSGGRRVRWHLAEVLSTGGLVDGARRIREAAGRRGIDASTSMRRTAEVAAALIDSHMAQIVGGLRQLSAPRTTSAS